MSVSAKNGLALRSAVEVGHLQGNVAKDEGRIGLAFLGKTLVQLIGEDVVPQATSDSQTNGSSRSAEQTRDGVDGSNVLVGDGGHDGDGAASGEDTAAKTNQELRKGEDASRSARLAKRDQDGSANKHDGNTSIGGPLEVSGVADDEANDGGKEGSSQ